jgi:hypothetical protein
MPEILCSRAFLSGFQEAPHAQVTVKTTVKTQDNSTDAVFARDVPAPPAGTSFHLYKKCLEIEISPNLLLCWWK